MINILQYHLIEVQLVKEWYNIPNSYFPKIKIKLCVDGPRSSKSDTILEVSKGDFQLLKRNAVAEGSWTLQLQIRDEVSKPVSTIPVHLYWWLKWKETSWLYILEDKQEP